MKIPEEVCDQLFNELHPDVKRWLICIITEYQDAVKKHPDWPVRPDFSKNHVDQEWTKAAAIVCEETGELIRAALQFEDKRGRYYNMHQEAIQSAAMCLRFLINAPATPETAKGE